MKLNYMKNFKSKEAFLQIIWNCQAHTMEKHAFFKE